MLVPHHERLIYLLLLSLACLTILLADVAPQPVAAGFTPTPVPPTATPVPPTLVPPTATPEPDVPAPTSEPEPTATSGSLLPESGRTASGTADLLLALFSGLFLLSGLTLFIGRHERRE
jgi:hypothetical protein